MSSFLAAVTEIATSRAVPTLEQLCIDHLQKLVAQNKIYDIELTNIEDELVLKLLKRLPVKDLEQLEEYNLDQQNHDFPSDAIWKWHCAREFGKTEATETMQKKWFEEYNVTSWKALYNKKTAAKQPLNVKDALSRALVQTEKLKQQKTETKMMADVSPLSKTPLSRNNFSSTNSRPKTTSTQPVSRLQQMQQQVSRNISNNPKPRSVTAKSSSSSSSNSSSSSSAPRKASPFEKLRSLVQSERTLNNSKPSGGRVPLPLSIPQQPKQVAVPQQYSSSSSAPQYLERVVESTRRKIDFTQQRPPSPNRADFASPMAAKGMNEILGTVMAKKNTKIGKLKDRLDTNERMAQQQMRNTVYEEQTSAPKRRLDEGQQMQNQSAKRQRTEESHSDILNTNFKIPKKK